MPAEFPILEKQTIIIAEDEPINFMLLEKMIEPTRATVLWAKDGKQALAHYKANKGIACIIMDIRMPVMDGITATREIRRLDTDIPIIAATAFSLSNEREQCMEAGTNVFLTKPIDPKSLANILRSLIST